MFNAQLLIAKSSAYSIWGAWMPRDGNGLRATLEVVDEVGAPTLKVEIFTKNSEESGPGDNADTAGTPTTKIELVAKGRATTEWLGDLPNGTIEMKELVRYKYTITGDAGREWCLFRMLSPVWFDDVHA